MRNNFVLTSLLVVLFAVLLAVNGVFIASYIKAVDIKDNGFFVSAKVVDVIQKAERGRRLSKYSFATAYGIEEYSLKERLKVNEEVKLMVSSRGDTRAFKVEGEVSWFQIYNGLTGSLIITLSLIASHLAVAIVTAKSFNSLCKLLRVKLTKRSAWRLRLPKR